MNARLPDNARRMRSLSAALLAGVLPPSLSAAQDAPAHGVDTSEWVCEYCPFEQGFRSDVDVGASVVSDDSAYFGNVTGYDEEGTYLNLDGEGSYVRDSLIWDWSVEDLGLDSRYATTGLRRQGVFDLRLDYRELPRREFITTRSIFDQTGSGALLLPDDWIRGGSTRDLPLLEQSLGRRDIEGDRSLLGVGGDWLAWGDVSVSADYRRQRWTGNNILGGSHFSVASLLPMPFVFETDEVDLEARYSVERGYLSLAWYLSDFESGGQAFGWESPFTTVPGAEFSQLAQPPDNRFQQVSLTGGYRFRTLDSFVRLSAAAGRIEQDDALLDYTTNPNLSTEPLPAARLDGEVETARVALTAGARPLERGRVELSYVYDERNNQTPRRSWNRVITDSFLSGDPELNNPYSYQRMRVELEGSYDLFDSTRLSAGIEYRDIERDLQEVAEQDETTGWGRVRWRPGPALSLQAEIGTARRDIDRYDEGVAVSFGQNPILRKYNLAYRYREFGEIMLDGALADGRLGWSLSARLADDSYSQSRLGLISADERNYAGELNWTVSDRSSLYVHGGLETVESVQLGSESFAEPDWRAFNEDQFVTVGAGFRLRQIADKVDFELSGIYSDGTSEIDVASAGGGPSRFPDLKTTMEYVDARITWPWSDTLRIAAALRYQHFDADDWALAGVNEATIPQVLTLGANPWDEEQFIFGLSFEYVAAPEIQTGSDE